MFWRASSGSSNGCFADAETLNPRARLVDADVAWTSGMLTADRLARLCRARDQLEIIGLDEPSIDDAARTAAMSRYHFVRQFRAVFGETPSRFRTRTRLERAKQLLAYGNDPITEICLQVGYTSLGSFSALFVQRFGRSPSAFREQHRNAPERLTPDCVTLLNEASMQKAANAEKPRTREVDYARHHRFTNREDPCGSI